MKKHGTPIVKEALRSIWQTRTRFLSLLTIVAVGCGFFAGLKASCPDMQLSADQFYEDSRLMDLHLMSTFGLTEDDLDAIQKVEGIRGFAAGYSADLLVKSNDASETVVKVYSLPKEQNEADENYLNRPILLEGRFPEKSGECVIEQRFNYGRSESSRLKIGDTVQLLSGKQDTELSDVVDRADYTIVGVVQSPMYIGYNRGHSTIGDGEVDAYLMIPEEDFSLEVHTDAYLTLEAVEGMSAFSDEYEDVIADASERFKAVGKERSEERYHEIWEESQEKINEA